jgi:hypothetical protein
MKEHEVATRLILRNGERVRLKSVPSSLRQRRRSVLEYVKEFDLLNRLVGRVARSRISVACYERFSSRNRYGPLCIFGPRLSSRAPCAKSYKKGEYRTETKHYVPSNGEVEGPHRSACQATRAHTVPRAPAEPNRPRIADPSNDC